MRKKLCYGLVGALAVLGLILGLTGPAHSQRPRPPKSLTEMIADDSGVAVKDVEKVLKALGPNAARVLARGETVDLPRFGTLRVVRIPEHRNMDFNGRPITVAAVNYVEFLPYSDVVTAANALDAVPAATVPPFEYHPITDRIPRERMPNVRTPNIRTP
jgi:nucleoid DNA-binding protein